MKKIQTKILFGDSKEFLLLLARLIQNNEKIQRFFKLPELLRQSL